MLTIYIVMNKFFCPKEAKEKSLSELVGVEA